MNNILQILANDKELIVYRKELRQITGSVTSTILLQQIIYWNQKMGGKFYKFIEPCKHSLYIIGDSWQEELGFSKKEFQTAFKKLNMLDICSKKINADRVTYYFLNVDKLMKLLSNIYDNKDKNREKIHGSVPKCQKERRYITKRSIPKYQKERTSTTENTTENTTTIESSSCSNNDKYFSKWLDEKSKNKKNPSAYAANIKRKFLKNEQSIFDEFEYWKREKNYQDTLENVRGKLIETTIGRKTILCAQKESNGTFEIFFEGGGSLNIKNIEALKTIINQNNDKAVA